MGYVISIQSLKNQLDIENNQMGKKSEETLLEKIHFSQHAYWKLDFRRFMRDANFTPAAYFIH